MPIRLLAAPEATLEGEFVLPDGRRWELVSPAEKEGARFLTIDPQEGLDWGLVQAAASGQAIAALATSPPGGDPEGYSNFVSVLATRDPAGWSSEVLAPPHAQATGISPAVGTEYRAFSEDLSEGVVQPFGNFLALAAEATEATPYVHTNYGPAGAPDRCTAACYLPLVTAADTPPGAEFGGQGIFRANGDCELLCGPLFIDATPDLAHLVLKSQVPLTTPAGGNGLYEWTAGELQPLYELPAGEGGGTATPGRLSYADNQLSEDGSLFFTSLGHVYLQDFARRESLRLDVAQGVPEPAEDAALFAYASPDGRTMFFTDPRQLTTAAGGGTYACRIVEDGGQPTCQLALLEQSTQDTVIGTSHDGSYAYLDTASGVALAHWNGTSWSLEPTPVPTVSGQTKVSANGLWLTFSSSEELTGYDSHNTADGSADAEIYLYDAARDRLICASCDPTGAPPQRAVASWLPPSPAVYEVSLYSGQGLPNPQPRYLTDSGRLFFDSNEALVPSDANGAEDVYEYEPLATGSCATATPAFSAVADGCLYLISSATSAEPSSFLDASESGGDVFFLTSASLLTKDFDGAPDVYDAHQCTEQVPCATSSSGSPSPCSDTEACRQASTVQPENSTSAASEGVTGPGNAILTTSTARKGGQAKALSRAQLLARALRSCHAKRKLRARRACEASARRRYATPKGLRRALGTR